MVAFSPCSFLAYIAVVASCYVASRYWEQVSGSIETVWPVLIGLAAVVNFQRLGVAVLGSSKEADPS